jgi:hypothetical protein
VVNDALTVGGVAGILLSGGFVYWQIGRYAAPQVPQSLFDERKLFIAYAVGLFIGAPLTLPFLFYLAALSNGALPIALVDLGLLLAGTELAIYAFLRTRYFGETVSRPFYALAARVSAGGILVVALVTSTATALASSWVSDVLVALQSTAVVTVSAAAGYLAVRLPDRRGLLSGSPAGAALFAVFGYALIGGAEILDPATGAFSASLAVLGAGWVVYRLRDPVLGRIAPPTGLPPAPETESQFRRLAP